MAFNCVYSGPSRETAFVLERQFEPGNLHDVYATPGGARLLIRPELRICVPTGSFDDVLYAPPGGAGLLIRPELGIRVPPGGFHDVLCPPLGGAGLLFRLEFDDSCAPLVAYMI